MGSAITENERTVTGMAEYIEREALLKFIENGINNPDRKEAFGYDAVEILEKVQYMDAADVAPVRHGRWIEPHHLYYGAKQYVCSLCWAEAFWDKHAITEKYPCCPNCGAIMEDADA